MSMIPAERSRRYTDMFAHEMRAYRQLVRLRNDMAGPYPFTRAKDASALCATMHWPCLWNLKEHVQGGAFVFLARTPFGVVPFLSLGSATGIETFIMKDDAIETLFGDGVEIQRFCSGLALSDGLTPLVAPEGTMHQRMQVAQDWTTVQRGLDGWSQTAHILPQELLGHAPAPDQPGSCILVLRQGDHGILLWTTLDQGAAWFDAGTPSPLETCHLGEIFGLVGAS